MMKLHSKRTNQQGFTLIEVMVAFAVLAFGLLAVASFQSKLVSGSAQNKARAEAVAIAQQKLDQIRSYVNEPELVANLSGATAPTATDNYPANIPDGTYPQNAGVVVPETINGTNAEFSRQWAVALTGDNADVTVAVSWEDSFGETQTVSLNSVVTWRNPRGSADITELDSPLVPSATGRAYLGDGHVDNIPADKDNGDGTSDGDFDLDGDLELVDNATGDVVLTLRDACNTTTNVCLEFVKVSGRVYIDDAASAMTLSDIYVLASDAAYCARDLAHASATANGDYLYYDYTCYIGGGWHGNIGVLMSGGNSNDASCVGDPTASTSLGTDKWRRYELAKRRVYRGMIHKVDAFGAEITNADGDTLFYSQGISDAQALPDPDWAERNYGHNFVITRVTGAGTGGGTATDCLPALTLPDAVAGDLFYGNANDFVCLNADNVPNLNAAGVDSNIYSPYLDYYDNDVYRVRNDCPYDPSDPPSWRFTISGTINTPSTPAAMSVMTSDGTDNCAWTISGTSTTYTCDVYAWENNDGTINGWNGSVSVGVPDDMLCAKSPVDLTSVYSNPAVESYTNVTNSNNNSENYSCVALASPVLSGTIMAIGSDLSTSTVIATEDGTGDELVCDIAISTTTTTNDTASYSCTVVEPAVSVGWSGVVTFTPPVAAAGVCGVNTWTFTGQTAPSPNNDYYCAPTFTHTIAGTIVESGGVDLTGVTVGASIDGSCETVVEAGGASATYKCQLTEHGAGWTGSIYITPPVGLACTPSSFTRNGLVIDETFADAVCAVPPTGSWLTLAGAVTVSNGASLAQISVVSSDGPCSALDGAGNYTCSVWEDGSGWSGSVVVSSAEADAICTPGSHAVPLTAVDVGIATTDCTLDLSGVVTISGNIWIYDITRAAVTGITMTNGSCTFATTGGDYTCITNTIAGDATWTGDVLFSSNKEVCGTNPLTFTGVAPRATLGGNNVVIQQNLPACP